MSMVINHNMMAANAARNLGTTYGKLSTSVQRLSSGLRINSAADDAAGLAIREMMRADIATTQQGIRNAADAISMIQTADGGLAVIDEKLTRMKELAEQAATGTYTTIQREIINSEYQAMAAEIDRIANATNFNGIKLLDGSVSNQHGGQGIKIHFGVSNNAAEDYYFVNVGDARATSSTGLRVGGDAKNDVWGQGAAGAGPLAGPGCCTAGFPSLNGKGIFTSGETFSFGYNWDWLENNDANLLSGKYLAGRYEVNGTDSLQDLIDKVNLGSQSRVGIKIDEAMLENGIRSSSGTVAICIGEESYYWGSAGVAEGAIKNVQNHTYAMSATDAAGEDLYTIQGAGHNKTYVASGGIQAALEALKPGSTKVLMVSGVVHDLEVGQSATSAQVVNAVNKDLNEIRKSINGFVTSSSTLDTQYASGNATYTINGKTVTGYGSAAVAALLSSGVISSAATAKSATVTLSGIYGTSANGGGWTRDADLAKAMGWSQLKVVIPTASQGAAAISTAIENAFAAFGNEFVVSPRNADTFQSNIDAADVAGLNPPIVELPAREKFVGGIVDSTKQMIQIDDNDGSLMGGYTAESLATAINENANSKFWAMTETASDGSKMVYVFCKDGGDNNSIRACEVGGRDAISRATLDAVSFENVETGEFHGSGTSFTLGGQDWGTLSPIQTKATNGFEVWNLTLNGRDVGKERDLWIANPGELVTPGLNGGTINGMDRDAFVEIQNAADGNWAGAEVRTQSSAQESLDALTDAIVRKDNVRAALGSMQNRLENTITNLEIQAENLQASESRISDVDVATEMTEFTKNNVMTQAATSMLAQANSLSQLALSLLG